MTSKLVLFVLLMFTGVSCDSVRAVEDVIPQDGLVAFYTMDGNVDGDVSGAVGTSDRFGDSDGAYYFDGLDDYIRLGSGQRLKPEFPLSISMWVRVDQIGSSTAPFATSVEETVNTGAWIAFSSGQGKASINFGNGESIGRTSRRTKIGETSLEEGRWYHIVGVIRDAEDMSIYVDGVDDGGVYEGPAGSIVYGTGAPTLGRRYTGLGNPPVYFEGAVDELAIYNQALTALDVRQLFVAGDEVRK